MRSIRPGVFLPSSFSPSQSPTLRKKVSQCGDVIPPPPPLPPTLAAAAQAAAGRAAEEARAGAAAAAEAERRRAAAAAAEEKARSFSFPRLTFPLNLPCLFRLLLRCSRAQYRSRDA